MAATDLNRPYASGSTARIGTFFMPFVSAIVAWNDARMTRNSLSSLSDRELDDIGLHRGDIDTVVGRY